MNCKIVILLLAVKSMSRHCYCFDNNLQNWKVAKKKFVFHWIKWWCWRIKILIYNNYYIPEIAILIINCSSWPGQFERISEQPWYDHDASRSQTVFSAKQIFSPSKNWKISWREKYVVSTYSYALSPGLSNRNLQEDWFWNALETLK